MPKNPLKFPKKNCILSFMYILFIIAFFIFYTTANPNEKYFLAVLAVMVLLMPISLVGTVRNIRYCIKYFKNKRILQEGKDGVCHITDRKVRYINNKRWNRRYALIVEYVEDGIKKTFTTGYEYLAVEYRYLLGLSQIKCKFKGKFLFITETIPQQVYKNLTVYGIDNSKFRRVLIIIWQIMGYVGAVLLFIGIVLTILFENSLYLIVGVLCLFIPTGICAFIWGLHFLVKFLILGE